MFNKPKFAIGDIVYDCIGVTPEKREVTHVEERGLFAKPIYYLRNMGAEYKSSEIRHESYLQLHLTTHEYITNEAAKARKQNEEKRFEASVKEFQGNIKVEAMLPKHTYKTVCLRRRATIGGVDYPKGYAFVAQRLYKDRIAITGEGVEPRFMTYNAFDFYMTTELPEPEEWFDVLCTEYYEYFYDTGVRLVKGGAVLSASVKGSGSYKVMHKGVTIHMSDVIFSEHFEKYDINDYATEFPRKKEATLSGSDKEENAMGAELYGYPPEEESIEETSKVAEVQRIARAEIAKEQAKAKAKALQAQLDEQTQKNEVARREQVAEEFGVVTANHLWDVRISIPTKFLGVKAPNNETKDTEVFTENRNMVEAALAAEAMAKGIDEDAHVMEIQYLRKVGGLR